MRLAISWKSVSPAPPAAVGMRSSYFIWPIRTTGPIGGRDCEKYSQSEIRAAPSKQAYRRQNPAVSSQREQRRVRRHIAPGHV